MPRKAIDEMNSPHLLGFGATPQGLSSMQWHVTLLWKYNKYLSFRDDANVENSLILSKFNFVYSFYLFVNGINSILNNMLLIKKLRGILYYYEIKKNIF